MLLEKLDIEKPTPVVNDSNLICNVLCVVCEHSNELEIKYDFKIVLINH